MKSQPSWMKKCALFSGVLLIQLPLLHQANAQSGFYISRTVDAPSVEINFSALEQLGQTDAKRFNDTLGPKEFLQPSFNPNRRIEAPVDLVTPKSTAPLDQNKAITLKAPATQPKSGLVTPKAVTLSKPKQDETKPKAAPKKAPSSGLVAAQKSTELETKETEKTVTAVEVPKTEQAPAIQEETQIAAVPKAISTPEPVVTPEPEEPTNTITAVSIPKADEIEETASPETDNTDAVDAGEKTTAIEAVNVPAPSLEYEAQVDSKEEKSGGSDEPVVNINEEIRDKPPVKIVKETVEETIETAAIVPKEEPVLPKSESVAAPILGTDPVSIAFEEGESSLPKNVSDQLDDVAAYMASNTLARIQIRGYAALGLGNVSESRKLSLYRSMAVRTYLQNKGIKSIRMDVRALGNTDNSGANLERVDIVFP